jgi:hypothetical protein
MRSGAEIGGREGGAVLTSPGSLGKSMDWGDLHGAKAGGGYSHLEDIGPEANRRGAAIGISLAGGLTRSAKRWEVNPFPCGGPCGPGRVGSDPSCMEGDPQSQ